MAKLFGELCPACGGDGRKGLYPHGAGPLGLDCPYCFAFRELYVIGQVPSHATTLPNERTGERWFHVFDEQTRAPTDQQRRTFRIVERPHIAYGPIERPRRRTLPMLSPVGVVRHFKTGTFFRHGMTRLFTTSPVTSQRRHDQQKAFVEAYGTMKAQRQRRKKQREEIWFAFTLIGFILLAAAVAIGAGVFIGIYIFHLAIVHAQ